MRFVIQVVQQAAVAIPDENYSAQIGMWLLIYVWIHKDDVNNYKEKIAHFVSKIRGLQVFHVDWKLQWSLASTLWEILLISNFTLYWENKKGNRFDFSDSASFEEAKMIYDELLSAIQATDTPIKTGIFGANMQVQSQNDGPINLIYEL